MAVPTITSIVPANGHSGGKTLVEISGSGFRLYGAPPATGIAPPASSPVRVLFDGVEAESVSVVSDELLYCLTPEHDPIDLPNGAYGAVDVVVANIDDVGDPIPGESATLPEAYAFVRPDLTQDGELSRVIRRFIRMLKGQIHPNVSFVTHTDYDQETGDLLNTAIVQSLPAIVISGLELPENRSRSGSEVEEQTSGGDRFVKRRAPVFVDAVMTIVGVAGETIELLNMIEATRLFFQKNTKVKVQRVEGDPSKGLAEYDLHFSMGTPVSTARQEDNSNVQSFAGEARIEGILLEDIPGLPTEKPAGIPAHYPHEATQEFGYVADVVSIGIQRKDD